MLPLRCLRVWQAKVTSPRQSTTKAMGASLRGRDARGARGGWGRPGRVRNVARLPQAANDSRQGGRESRDPEGRFGRDNESPGARPPPPSNNGQAPARMRVRAGACPLVAWINLRGSRLRPECDRAETRQSQNSRRLLPRPGPRRPPFRCRSQCIPAIRRSSQLRGDCLADRTCDA